MDAAASLNLQHLYLTDLSPREGTWNWQQAMSNARDAKPAPLYKWDKNRRNDWEEVRNRQLHRAYVTPVVPGDWLHLVKTQEDAPLWSSAPAAANKGLAPVPEVQDEGLTPETHDVMAALAAIGDKLQAQRKLNAKISQLVPPSNRTQKHSGAVSYHAARKRTRARLEKRSIQEEKDKKPISLTVQGLTSNLHIVRRPGEPPEVESELPPEVKEAYSRPTNWSSDATATPRSTARSIPIKHEGSAALSMTPMVTPITTPRREATMAGSTTPRKPAGISAAASISRSKTSATLTVPPPARSAQFSVTGQKVTPMVQSESVPTETLNPHVKSKLTSPNVKRLRPRSRTSMKSFNMSNASFDEGALNRSRTHGGHNTSGMQTRMFPDLDVSSPLVRQHQYTPHGGDDDDDWETDAEASLPTSPERKRRKRRRKSARQRSRRGTREPDGPKREKSNVSFDDSMPAYDNTQDLRMRERKRKSREYDSSRATSALPPPENDDDQVHEDDEDDYYDHHAPPPPKSGRTHTVRTVSTELPELGGGVSPTHGTSQARLDDGFSQTGFSQTGTASTNLPSQLQPRPESPEWEDEDVLDRTTTSRGTNRDSYRNLDPLSKRRLDAKKSLLYKKLQANIVKKRYDKIH